MNRKGRNQARHRVSRLLGAFLAAMLCMPCITIPSFALAQNDPEAKSNVFFAQQSDSSAPSTVEAAEESSENGTGVDSPSITESDCGIIPAEPSNAGNAQAKPGMLPPESRDEIERLSAEPPMTRAGPLSAPKNGGNDASAFFHAVISSESDSIANGQYTTFNVAFAIDRGMINAGDYITVSAASTLKDVALAMSPLIFQEKIDLGNGQYRLIFNENAINGISGTFSLSAFGNNNTDAPTTATVTVGNASKTITVGAGSHPVGPTFETRGIVKWGYSGEGYRQDTAISGIFEQSQDVTITFAIEADPRMSVMTNAVITDTLPAEMIFDRSSVRIVTEYADYHSGPELSPAEIDQIVSVSGQTIENSVGGNVVKTRKVSGDLTVTKAVTGAGGDRDKSFDFTVTLGDESIGGLYGDMSFEAGVATISLKDGESSTARGLPDGVSYEVAEADYSAEGYVTSSTGEAGTIVDNTTATAAFENHRNAPIRPVFPLTGDMCTLILELLGGACLVSLAGLIAFRRQTD